MMELPIESVVVLVFLAFTIGFSYGLHLARKD